jgi:hypothetical protein
MANFDDDVQDLERVIAWLKEQGYHIHLRTSLPSHSLVLRS